MDYQVFLLSRIKERYDETGDTREAVAHGLGCTAGIITGAAAIMVCVFGGTATGELVMFQQMGFGLAVAVLIVATIVRTIIVPAAPKEPRRPRHEPGITVPRPSLEGAEH